MKKLSALLLCATCICVANAQWNPDPMANNLIVPEGASHYATEINMSPNGTVWFMYYHPNLVQAEDEYDTANVVYEYRVQAIDKDGNKLFGDELGLLVSNYPARSYCVCNQYTTFDNEGNFIIAVHDCRNSPDGDAMSYTAYKISPDGQMLWDEDGVSLDGGITADTSAAMSLTALDDNSIVFAWMRDDNGVMRVDLQRVSAEGVPQWDIDEVSLYSATTPYWYPYVVNAGSNQVILVYGRGASSDLYARKLDFDGTQVWESDTRIYRGGWGSIPLWTKLCVVPSGDGGVLLGWNDDRDSNNSELPYISYVKGDGSLGFSAASDNGDVQLSWAEMQAWQIKVMPDPDNDGFLAVWRATDGSQGWEYPVIQRVSKSGELLFGDEGKPLTELLYTTYGFMSLQPGEDGTFATFWQEQRDGFGDVASFCQLIDSKTGETKWDEPFAFTPAIRERSSLKTCVNLAEKYWIAYWQDGGAVESPLEPDNLCIQRINFDKTFGSEHTTGIEDVASDNNNAFIYYNGKFSINLTSDTSATISIYDPSGKLVATPFAGELNAGHNIISWDGATTGVYIAQIRSNSYNKTIKITIN